MTTRLSSAGPPEIADLAELEILPATSDQRDSEIRGRSQPAIELDFGEAPPPP